MLRYITVNTGVNSTTSGFSIMDSLTNDSYCNISEMKLSITLLYIISDATKYDIIWTENSNVIDSFISDIDVQILDPCVQAQKILDREIHTYLTQ